MKTEYVVLLAVMTAAAICDRAMLRIPNILLLVGWTTGLVLTCSPMRAAVSLGTVTLLYPAAVKGFCGMGDVKLTGVICIFLGISDMLRCLLYGLCAAALLSVGMLLRRRELACRFRYFAEYIRTSVSTGSLGKYEGPDRKLAELPLAAAMLAGYVFFLIAEVTV